MYQNMVQPVEWFIASPYYSMKGLAVILGLSTGFAHSAIYRPPIPMRYPTYFYHRILVVWWLQKGYMMNYCLKSVCIDRVFFRLFCRPYYAIKSCNK